MKQKMILGAMTALVAVPAIVIPMGDVVKATEVGDFKYKDDMHGDIRITSYTGKDKDIVIPEYIDGRKVTSIGNNYENSLKMLQGAFEGKGLNSVVIPEGVTRLEWSSFKGNNLVEVKLPDSLKSIDNDAFKNNKIKELDIPHNIGALGDGSFENNQISKINIPNTLKRINENALKGNQLEQIKIPDSVIDIGAGAFMNNKITEIEIPSSVTTMPDNVLDGNQFVNSYLTVWGQGGTRAHAVALAKGYTFNEGEMERPPVVDPEPEEPETPEVPTEPETPSDTPNWSFDDTSVPYIGGKPTITVTGGKAVGGIELNGFDWVTEGATVATIEGDIELKPGKGGTVISIPEGLGDKNTSTTLKVDHEGQHFMNVVIKPVPKIDFKFSFDK